MVYNKRGEYCIWRSWPETEMSCTVGDRDVLYGQRRWCLVSQESVMSRMAGDGDVSYGQRWLLALVRADGIQPYWYVHIYTGLVALLDRLQLSFSIITISPTRNRWRSADTHFYDGAMCVWLAIFSTNSAKTSSLDGCNYAARLLPNRYDYQSLTLRWRSLLSSP
jgi:hypothetical protein